MTKIRDILTALLKNMCCAHARTLLLCVVFFLLCVAHKAVGAEGDELLNPPKDPPVKDEEPARPAPLPTLGPALKLPAAVQVLMERADIDFAKIREKSVADEGLRRAVLVAALEKAQSDATKKGDLNTALAIKARLDEQTALLPKKVVPKKAEPTPELVIPGTYRVSDTNWGVASVTLDQKGLVKASNGDAGTWLAKDGFLVITWYNGNTNRGKLATPAIQMPGDKGTSFTLTKDL